jgi:hypothetical protein
MHFNDHRIKAMGKVICGIKGALGPVNFPFLYMYKPCVLQRFVLSTMMPSVAPLLSKAAAGKQVPWRDRPRIPARFAG